EEFLHGGAKAVLEDNRLADVTERFQQKAVLHITGTHPENIDIIGHHWDLTEIHDFAGDVHVVLVGDLPGDLQAFFAQALEIIGGGARFPAHAAQNTDTAFGQGSGSFVHLLHAFDSTRAADDGEFTITDLQAVGQGDDR